MAEALGIISLCVEGISIAKSLVKLISTLQAAPNELLALANEVSNLNFVLQDIRDTLQFRGTENLDKGNSIGRLLDQASRKLEEVQTSLTRWTKLNPHGDSWHIGRRERFLWLKDRGRVVELQTSLRTIRADLTLAVEANTNASTSRLTIDLQTLASKTSRTHDMMVTLMDKFEKYEVHKIAAQEGKIDNSGDIMEAGNTDRERPVTLEVTRQITARKCPSGCHCVCHNTQRYKLPAAIECVAGRLFYGYSGKPLLSQQCSFSGCLGQRTTSSRMTYFFPRWFMERIVSLNLQVDDFGSPPLSLKTRRAVPEMSQIFTLSRIGDLQGLQELFGAKMASPNDIHREGQWTALHFAVDHGQIEVCQLLLNADADPEWEDYTGTTAVEIAWRNILQLRAPPEKAQVFSVLFPGSDFLEDHGFTQLHRIVIGLEHGSLEKIIELGPEYANTRDADGWTPLHWAARRGEVVYLSNLLHWGANPLLSTTQLLAWRLGNQVVDLNARDFYGNTPLRCAGEHNCAAALAHLIQAGADVNLVSKADEPPLWSAIYNDSHEAITQLVNAGADVSRKTKYGDTLLHFAAQQSDLKTLALLMRARLRGIDIDAKNSDGLTAKQLVGARIGAPLGFHNGFQHLLENLIDNDDASPTSSHSSGESWKSFSEASWHEVEASAGEDSLDAARETQQNSGEVWWERESKLLSEDSEGLRIKELD
ncbi:MAG: hypothetical protein M1821_001517 [Bathelium mastoideum]|nr:MAG: hypothetical protein M1821_001517 [Bathelium mastoideum]KAI9690047.1 MAG: hypothetical protein M1822_009929 [Bathelium mastoideum]